MGNFAGSQNAPPLWGIFFGGGTFKRYTDFQHNPHHVFLVANHATHTHHPYHICGGGERGGVDLARHIGSGGGTGLVWGVALDHEAGSVPWIVSVKTECDRDDRSLHCVAANARFCGHARRRGMGS